ncbi:hypothetical protein BCR44DRAFT_36354 [Catenaria anguillulae PL171]|uniref:Cyclin-like domain-containing protein n=1 Tax=Catenaria anguillulae PL171 TaxID=765915 RepID=A0A1Y2HSA8_9FUNG|nr:hypothetical protein BCR44DRAFT_36354 [Catenaria anguillulae PL171]
MERSRARSRTHPVAPATPTSSVPMPEPLPVPFAAKSASLRIMSILPKPTVLPSPTSSPPAQFQADTDLDADALLHDSLFSLSFPANASGPSDLAKPLLPSLASPPAPPSHVLAAFSAPLPPAARYSDAEHPFHQHSLQSMPLTHRLHHHPVSVMDPHPHPHSPFSTLHLPPSPAPSESSAYMPSFPDADCHSPKPVPSPTLAKATLAVAPNLEQPHIDLASITTCLDLPAELAQLARSALDSYTTPSRQRYSSNQLIAAAIICAARALNVNLSMCDTVKACGLTSVHQVRPVVSDLRRRSETLVAIESESDTESVSPSPSSMPEFVAVEVPLAPSSQSVPEEPNPQRPTRVGSLSRRRRPTSPSKPTAVSFAHLTPDIVAALSLPPSVHKHIEHVFRTSRQQIKLRRSIKGGMCGDESILGGAIYFVGKRLGMYPVSQAKVAEAVGRTPTTVKGMFDRICGMGDEVVPSEFRSGQESVQGCT